MIRKIDFTKMIYICLLSFISTYMIETMMCTCIRYWKRWPLSRLIVRVWMLCWDCPSDMFYWCWSCRRLVLNSMTKVSPWIYDVDTWKNTRKLQGRLRPVNCSNAYLCHNVDTNTWHLHKYFMSQWYTFYLLITSDMHYIHDIHALLYTWTHLHLLTLYI